MLNWLKFSLVLVSIWSTWPVQELSEWNARYREKFGFIFIICASGRSTDEILAELKVKFHLEFAFQADIDMIVSLWQ